MMLVFLIVLNLVLTIYIEYVQRYHFVVYEGKKTDVDNNSALGESVVLRLASKLTEPYYQLYFDNLFTNISLLEKLALRKIYGCGTFRTNRKKIPKDFPLDKYMKSGNSIAKHNNVTIGWIDELCSWRPIFIMEQARW